MSVTVNYDDATRTGTVTINPGLDGNNQRIEGWENLLLQMGIDRAAANTARVSIMQTQLLDQDDRINLLNGVLAKLLGAKVTKNGSQVDASTEGPASLSNFTALTSDEAALLNSLKDSSGNLLSTYLTGISAGAVPGLATGKSLNDVMSVLKSELNQATNLNQQTMINYQSLINQRDQMTEYVGNLITLLASAVSGTIQNLR